MQFQDCGINKIIPGILVPLPIESCLLGAALTLDGSFFKKKKKKYDQLKFSYQDCQVLIHQALCYEIMYVYQKWGMLKGDSMLAFQGKPKIIPFNDKTFNVENNKRCKFGWPCLGTMYSRNEKVSIR